MALNPIVYTERIFRSFLRYQLTAYPFSDERLHSQMRDLLSLDATRNSPLIKGPYISLSRPFSQGAAVDDLIRERIFHPHMRERIPAEIKHVYGHQEEAIRAIHGGRTTLVSTGTGSGKSECFLYPIISKCLELRDQKTPSGISAVIVYPMNALAEDQLYRLRGLLAGTGIPFGMYVGKTPEKEGQVSGIRLPQSASRADYFAKLEEVRSEGRSETVYPPEEVCSREIMRTPGRQPRILLTNVKQLELLLTRYRDVELFANARLDFLVFDEAHTFTGAQGAETACLIRRLRTFCGRDEKDTVCIATSATIVDQKNPDAARDFASRFFGIDKSSVATVGEAYERQVWAPDRSIPKQLEKDPASLLNAAVRAVDDKDDSDHAVREVYKDLSGEELPPGEWSTALFDALSRNEILYQLDELLARPGSLLELPEELQEKIGRHVSEEEILAWLTLGAAARSEGRPLVRPVIHAFVRGISGGVVSFPVNHVGPKLLLAAEDESAKLNDHEKLAHLPVMTCNVCGQHYFTTFWKDFSFTGAKSEGGDASGDGSFWEPLEEAQGGRRVILTDRLAGSDEDDLEGSDRTADVYLCRHCGAGHPTPESRCKHCGIAELLVPLYTIRQKKDNPGYLTSCLSCGSNGRRVASGFREPARPVRATNVSDVHVLAQDMVHHAERPRLLVFCDNRQDAAFQAGWMKDHSRRFRLRALMAEGLRNGPVSIGDLAMYVDAILNEDEALSRALAPEVWQAVRREGSGGLHEKERRKFLRIQVLREITMSLKQSIGLEPWGRLKVEYEGLNAGMPWIEHRASDLGISSEALKEGIAGLLDYFRRRRALYDPEREIFSKFWMDGDEEIQRGYLNQPGTPIGTRLQRDPREKPGYVMQWLSDKGDTTIRQMAKKWGVAPADVDEFLAHLFSFLREEGYLRPVTLKGSKGKPLPDISGVYQVDADRIRLTPHSGLWQCNSCRRRTVRRPPHMKCLGWRCDGDLIFVAENPDSYDLQLLDEGYSMLRPEEHTAMVPHDERERLENLFKGDSDVINTFVCTPTLELGVDIGQLDSVLMRNVPPLPANYWQRAGRAGRRHRMAVDVTYCRPVSHDRAYFQDPLKLLMGRVDPPAFNLRNEVMVAKHVHATVLTRLHQLANDSQLSKNDQDQINQILRSCIPDRISTYLFEEGEVRMEPYDLSPLKKLISSNRLDLVTYVEQAFRNGWPEEAAGVTSTERLQTYVDNMTDELEALVKRLRRRLVWALEQIERLNAIRMKKGDLEPEDDAYFKRCDKQIKRLKGTDKRSRHEAEGYDEVNTYGVLAAEGFLPGYGLEVGSVLGTAEIPFWRTGAKEFYLPRPASVALREYVPGNLIYANGHKFVARHFHRDIDEHRVEMPLFEVSIERQAIKGTNSGAAGSSLGVLNLRTISVCDVDLMHQSHISDEEELRFQMGVSVLGIERQQHNGGTAFQWGERALHFRRGVRMRLVNIGASREIARNSQLGYPLCTVCGQSISPLSSDRQHDQFKKSHKERCGRDVEWIGFYADVVADTLSLPACEDHQTAYSVLEAIRFAATSVLDMHMEDLQILVIGHVDRAEVDGLLWDPMPGGSGLLDQICDRFEEITETAKRILSDCPSLCDSSCVDCLQTFRNAFYHKYLHRHTGLERIEAWGSKLTKSHEIPPLQPAQPADNDAQPVNEAERRLRYLLLAAGFPDGIRGEQIKLDRAIGTTTPDIIYRGSHHDEDEGIAIYLDGLSAHIHGNSATSEKDQQIRSWLRNNGFEVIEIVVSELHDPGAMTRHFRKLANHLREDDLRDSVKKDTSWFDRAGDLESESQKKILRFVNPKPEERYVKCVPFIPLKAAAGAFSDPQNVSDDDWQWVEIDTHRQLVRGMFIAQVTGKSMEPTIPDGSYCLFTSPVTGSRQGKTVLVQLQDGADPESGQRYTVKRYESEKSVSDDGTWRHLKITLKPNNPAYQPIVLSCDDEGAVQVIAEMIEVIRA